LPLITAAVSAPKGIEISEFAHKVIDGPDDDGDLEISVKVNVRNTIARDQEVKIKVRAVDAEEYEVFDMPITGTVKARETRVLTDTQFISEKVYKTVVRWEIED
jgi:hypothetical protein